MSLDSSSKGDSSHYSCTGLAESILETLAASGKNIKNLAIDDLAHLDELHVRGRKATIELLAGVSLGQESRLLDIGCGIGGTARYLATTFGCRVTGIDLTAEYCRTASQLTSLLRLADLVDFSQADATSLPFPDCIFDGVLTIHTAMNILQKSIFYSEIRRVIRPGGFIAIYDILAGDGGDVHFPVPWARTPSCSHLVTPQELRNLLASAGFRVLHWRDTTDEGLQWFRRISGRLENNPGQPAGANLFFGGEFPLMASNQVLNLEERRIILAECIAEPI